MRRADPGSFRDPMSRVFVDDDGVWRGLSNEALADYERLAASTFFRDAIARGDIVGTERVDDVDAAGRVGRGAPARSHRRAVVPVRVAVRDAARRGAPPTRAHPRRARREADHQGRLGVQRAVRRHQAGLHRHRLVRAAARRRAVARLSPVLRAVPEPAARPGVARRAVPAVAARQHPRHLADDRGRVAARRRALHEGRVHPRQVARQGRAQVRRRRPRARRQGRTAAGRVRSRPDRRPAEEPREGDHRAEVGQAGLDVVGLRRSGALRRPGSAAPRSGSSPQPSRPGHPRRVLDLGANDGHFSRLALAGRRRVRRRRRLRRSRRRSPLSRPPARG